MRIGQVSKSYRRDVIAPLTAPRRWHARSRQFFNFYSKKREIIYLPYSTGRKSATLRAAKMVCHAFKASGRSVAGCDGRDTLTPWLLS